MCGQSARFVHAVFNWIWIAESMFKGWDLDANLDHIPCFRRTLVADHNLNLVNIPLNLELVPVTSLALLILAEWHRLKITIRFGYFICGVNDKYLHHLVGHPLNMVMPLLPSLLRISLLLPGLYQYFSYSESVCYQTNWKLVKPIKTGNNQ